MSRIYAWLGGALFVASLVLCTWWYVAVLGTPGQDLVSSLLGRPLLATTGRAWSVGFDVLIFGVFAAHHSVFARATVKSAMSRVVSESTLCTSYVCAASLLLMLTIAAWRPIGGDFYAASGGLAVLHAGVQLLGVAIIALAVRSIDPLELAGIRHPVDHDTLQIAGPYRWVRHPLYLGWVIAVFGAAHMTGDRLAFAAITTIYLMIAVPWEERSLRRTFGDEYRRYQQRVRWRIIPYLY